MRRLPVWNGEAAAGAGARSKWPDSRARFLHLLVALALPLAGCQSVDPATGQAKPSEAAVHGSQDATTGALVCGLATAINGGNGEQVLKNAAACGVAAGIAGFAAGSIEDQKDRELLAEFRQAGLSVSVRGNALVLNASERIGFEQGSASPDPAGQSLLRSVAKIVNRFPQRRVQVVGHTSPDENPALSLARANAARSILAANGVAAGRIGTTGLGSSEPLVAVSTSISAYRNRRVEIFFVPPY